MIAAALAATYTLVLGGDVMLNGVKFGTGPLAGVAPTFRNADFALVNLEIPLTNSTTPTKAKTAADLKTRNQYILKADPRHIASLKNAGIDMVSLANNHAMDYGPRGLAQMRALLAKNRIANAGAGPDGTAAAALAVATNKDGFRVGLLSALAFMNRGGLQKCTPAGPKPGVHCLSFGGKVDDDARAKLQSWIGAARKRCDYLVVALHWGIEKQTRPTAYQVALGRAAADAGADLVWGHHPHVLQPTETYKGVPILYSAGNLVSPRPGKTALYRLQIGRHTSSGLTVLPANINNGGVVLAETKARTP